MITYIEAMDIVEESEAFYVNRGEIQGYEYAMFNYRLADYQSFVDANLEKSKELRGLTFIKKEDKWERHLMLNKFWNLSENIGNEYKDFKDKKIKYIQNKSDGSLIRFITLPNGVTFPKTKMGFNNEQTDLVKKIITDEFTSKIREIYLNDGVSLFIEIVGYSNKIVLKYSENKLILLQGRYDNGQYLNKAELESYGRILNVELGEFFEIPQFILDMSIEEVKIILKDRNFNTFNEMIKFLM